MWIYDLSHWWKSLQGTPVYYNEMFYFIWIGELAKPKNTHVCALLNFVKHFFTKSKLAVFLETDQQILENKID